LKGEVDELKQIVMELATMQKKQTKVIRKQGASKPINKLVILPPQESKHSQSSNQVNYMMEHLRKSLE